MTEFLDDLEKTLNAEILWADRDCFRRRDIVVDLLQKIREQKKLEGLK